MARKAFLGFDFSQAGVPIGSAVSTFVDWSLPPGAFIVDQNSDTTFLSPGQTGRTVSFAFGRGAASGALGSGSFSTLL
ncbi:MAG: hypothetical protein ACKOET_06910, partial [Verrucomicrobiota bacterium]